MNAVLLPCFLTLSLAAPQDNLPANSEAHYFSVEHLTPPPGALLEVGGMDWLPGGELAVSTRRGQVWIVENALASDPGAARFRLFAEGLQEGLGLKVVDGVIHVLQRGELSRLLDTDRDGSCDTVETVSNGWGLSGNYHEFAFGLPRDDKGNFYLSLNVGFTEPKWWHGRANVPWRGWVLRVRPDGVAEPFAMGFRSPAGIGMDDAGNLFVTDNQGDWMPVCPLHHVREGRFYGAPASLKWTPEYQAAKSEPSVITPADRERTPPALWFPYKWSRSTGDMRTIPRDGSFGPYGGQLAVAELTNGLVLRADLERVRGELQGACFLVRQEVGSAVRTLFAPDGTLMLGLTNRGWGGLGPAQGLARVRKLATPFEIEHVRLQAGGFLLELSEPLAPGLALFPENFEFVGYHYDYWWEYGSPERGHRALKLRSFEVAADRRSIRVQLDDLEAGEVVRGIVRGLVNAGGAPLLHEEFHYTVNQLVDGPLSSVPVARVVPPPPVRQSSEEGSLRVCYGECFDLFQPTQWKLCEVELDAAAKQKFRVSEGFGALASLGLPAGSRFESQFAHGDARIEVELMFAEGAHGTLELGGGHALRLGSQDGSLTTKAGIAPGNWQRLSLDWRAPRFDAAGTRIEAGRVEGVSIDNQRVLERLEFAETGSGEQASGKLAFVAGSGDWALRGLTLRPLSAGERVHWPELMEADELAGWKTVGGAQWKREEGELVSSGPQGWLVTERESHRNFELRMRCRISDGGLANLNLRCPSNGQGGYSVRINASHPDPEKTGSIVGLAPRKVQLVPADTRMELRARCQDTPDGTRVQVWVNGVLVNQFVDAQRRFAAGAIALEHHHEGSRLEVLEFELQQLP